MSEKVKRLDGWYELRECWQMRRCHIYFMLEHLEMLEEGKYPPEPKEELLKRLSDDPKVQLSPRGHAPFQSAADLISECTRRIAAADLAGQVTLMHYRGQRYLKLRRFAGRKRRKNVSYSEIRSMIRSSIKYASDNIIGYDLDDPNKKISIWKGYFMPYEEWLEQQNVNSHQKNG